MPDRGKVLIIEDDAHLAYLLCSKLRILGWNPEAVGTFGAGMAAVKKGDIVILDPGLPDSIPGKSLANIFQLKERGAKRVVVITGAFIDEGLRRVAIELGADVIFSKDATDFREGIELEFGRIA